MTTVHIHAPAATAKRAVATHCPDCKHRTRMLQFFTPWYGWSSTCIKCGREWEDGHWMQLDFCRSARQINIQRAKNKWRAMPPKALNHFGIA